MTYGQNLIPPPVKETDKIAQTCQENSRIAMSRDLPSLNALRAFEAAARLHSISLAAEELHVTMAP